MCGVHMLLVVFLFEAGCRDHCALGVRALQLGVVDAEGGVYGLGLEVAGFVAALVSLRVVANRTQLACLETLAGRGLLPEGVQSL